MFFSPKTNEVYVKICDPKGVRSHSTYNFGCTQKSITYVKCFQLIKLSCVSFGYKIQKCAKILISNEEVWDYRNNCNRWRESGSHNCGNLLIVQCAQMQLNQSDMLCGTTQRPIKCQVQGTIKWGNVCLLSWQAPVDEYEHQEEGMNFVIKAQEIFLPPSTISLNSYQCHSPMKSCIK